MADRPALDLTTNKPRKQVRVDGVHYDMRLSEDLSLYEGRQLDALMRQMSDIESIKDLTAEQGDQYNELLARIVLMGVPDMPTDVVHRLSTGQRKAVVVTFYMLSALSHLPARANAQRAVAAALSNGRKQFLASRSRTAARRKTGSKRR